MKDQSMKWFLILCKSQSSLAGRQT